MLSRIVLLVILFAPATLCAQSTGAPERLFQPYGSTTTAAQVDTPATMAPGKVEVHADAKVEELMRQYSAHSHVRQGYRVQIFLGDRKTAEETKRSFLQKNPDTPAYLSWLAPNFRLRVGDLTTRLQAEHLLRDLRVIYPGCYIVPDEIETPALVAPE